MNNGRRRAIRSLIRLMENRNTTPDSIIYTLNDLLLDEETARDNTPESLMDSEAYTIREESCDLLQEAIDELDGLEGESPDFSEVISLLESIDGV